MTPVAETLSIYTSCRKVSGCPDRSPDLPTTGLQSNVIKGLEYLGRPFGAWLMEAVEGMGESIRLVAPTTQNEWLQADTLIAELQEWDVQQSQALGFAREEVLSVFYPSDCTAIRRDSARPEGCFLLAVDAGVPVGCAAFRQLTRNACELYDVYVRPTCRGRGVGSLLLRQMIAAARSAGYVAMCLETATFMHAAQHLYRSLHFQVREPYRSLSARYIEVTLWMELRLT